ncbi:MULTISPECIES: ATP-binding protein [Intestinimonas]|uniref:ATP-binding protein n=1 Tax=Intestinimonas TaxID=1392389 RepID=UPI0018A00281|nr:ATP-binding protein [Intestinimonas butyriciproducens]
MLTEELIELAKKVCKQKSEEQTIEVKAAHIDCPKRLYDTLSSFSNQDYGGILLFGLDERTDFQIVGIYDPQDLQKKVTEQCLQMEPPVRAVFSLAEIDGKSICAAEIPSLDISERPCYYRGAGRTKGAFIRVGDADLPMTDYELYSFESFRKHLHDDERVIERASLDMLDQDKLQDYVRQKSIERPGFSQLTLAQAQEMLNLTRNNIPTLASIMNFCIYPQGYFPQLAITAVVVPGTEIGDIDSDAARFIDNKRIEGTIPVMVEDALSFCKRNMKIRTIIDPDTGARRDKTEYPVDAIREAILNALIHRDYSIHTEGTPVQIDFFSDRLEIHSPGSLYGRMSVEQLGIAKPDLRNPALAVMAETLTSAEHRYSGIPTMRRTLREHGLPEPKFENRRNEFVVIFYNGAVPQEPTRQPVAERTLDTLEDFCRTPRSRNEIAEYLGVKTTFYAMQHYVKPLLECGTLAMTIPEKPKSRNQKYYTVSSS